MWSNIWLIHGLLLRWIWNHSQWLKYIKSFHLFNDALSSSGLLLKNVRLLTLTISCHVLWLAHSRPGHVSHLHTDKLFTLKLKSSQQPHRMGFECPVPVWRRLRQVRSVTLLLHTWEVPCSNLNWAANCLDWSFSWYSLFFPGKYQSSGLKYASKSLPTHHSRPAFYLSFCCYLCSYFVK